MGIGFSAYSQFTVVPTGASTEIWDIILHSDTIVISGRNNFFAKSFDMGNSVIPYSSPGISGGYNFDLQIRGNNYYILSGIGFPTYQYQVLKSSDYGNNWQVLFDTSGAAFYTFSMIDTTWGAIAGTFGNYAYANGSDTSWILDTLFGSTSLHSLASGFYGDSTMLFLTVDGMAISTTDRGQNWYWGYGMNATHEEIQFLTKDTVYSISHESSGTTSYFSKSINGGHNFSTISLGPNAGDSTYYGTYFDTDVKDFWFVTSAHGFIVGYNYDLNESVIFETNDYGQNWTVFHTGFTDAFYSLLFVNDSTAFIGGANGLLLKWNPSIPLQPVGIIENYLPSLSFQVYPNPTDEEITVMMPKNIEAVEIFILNTLGEKIFSFRNVSNNITISTTEFPNGVYFITLRNGDLVSSRKLVIQH